MAIYGLEPEDGIWEITGKKLWRWDGETNIDDIRKAITQVQLQNNQGDLQHILELTLRFIDLTTATPTIFQGETKEVPDTLGATGIVVDSNNVTFRSKVKRWDDMITIPHITRWYDYHMQYNKDDSIKGDFNIEAVGASVLYERDQMRQHITNLFQLRQFVPELEQRTDWVKAVEMYYSFTHLDSLFKQGDQGDVPPTPTPEQIKAEAALQLEQLKQAGDKEVEMLRQQNIMAELEWKGQQADMERQHQVSMKDKDLQIQMMIYAEKRNISLDSLKVQLALHAASTQTQKELAQKEQKQVAPVAEVSKPLVEPEGKAPTGYSYPM
jgi:hypothetical protein